MDRRKKSPFCAATPAVRPPQRGLHKRRGVGEGSI